MLTDEIRKRMIDAVSAGDVATVRHLAFDYKSCRNNRAAVDELNGLLRNAIHSQQVDVVDALIAAGADINHEDADGQRALHHAAKVGSDVTLLKLLIRSGTLVNAVDRNGNSALHISALQGYRDISLALIDAGAAVNRPRRYDTGEAPIHAIARTGDSIVMSAALRRAGGRPDLHASNGVTPLHLAAREHNSGCVEALCTAARSIAIISTTDNSCITPLHCAVQVSSLDCVRILLQQQANPNAVDRDGLTPLHYAAGTTHPPLYSHASVVDLLLSFGADVRLRDSQHRTALHIASATGNASLVSALLSAGANVDAVERILGETALNIAAAYGRHDVMRRLMEAGCDVNIADKHGVTPLHKLLASGANVDRFKYDSVDLLLRHGAKVNVCDDRGATPLGACVFHSIISRHSSDGLSVLRRLVSAGALLESMRHNEFSGTQRALRNSALCWLTWHGEFTAAAFLVNAGWKVTDEAWIVLPGKTELMETFLAKVRAIACNTYSLGRLCRAVIRTRIQLVMGDCDLVPLIERLPLPLQIQNFLKFDTECDVLD